MRREVEFTTEDGTILRGLLHTNEQDVPAPTIVMAHGFSGVKEQIGHYAAHFAHAGFTVLAYDHRGFGASEGKLRLEVDPYRQMADWLDALTYVESLAEVDAERIGVWGSSFAGGLAMAIAAGDSRVKCVVAQIPFVSGHRNARELFSVAQRGELRSRLAADRATRAVGGLPAMIPVFSADPREPSALPVDVDQAFIDSGADTAPRWQNQVTLRSVEHMMTFEPAGWIPHVAPKPLLMIVAAADVCTFPEIQLDAYATAREPKKLVVHPGGHFETYTKHFAETSQPALDWFSTHLGK